MPLTWVIDHPARMVVATGAGILRLEDFEAALDELARPATLSYRKLVDLTHCSQRGHADMLDLVPASAATAPWALWAPRGRGQLRDEDYRQASAVRGELDGIRRPRRHRPPSSTGATRRSTPRLPTPT